MCNFKTNSTKSQEKINNYFYNDFNKSINEKANIWHNLKSASVKTAKLLLNSDREKEVKRGQRMLSCGSFINYGIDNDDFLKIAMYNNEQFEKLYKTGSTLFNLEYETTIKSLEEMGKLGEIKHKFKSAHFCKSRLCPICQWKKLLRKRAEMYKILPSIKEENKSIRFLFMTLTIRNCQMEELKATIKKLNDGLRAMLKDEKLRFIKGSIKSLEITQGKSEENTAHPHLHLLLAVSSTFFKGCNYLTFEKWRELWKKYLNIDYNPQINVQAIKENTDIIRELIKTSLYIEKETLDTFDEDIFLQYSRQVDNTRTYELTGIFKEYRKKTKTNDKSTEVIDDETGETIDLDMLINSIVVEYLNNQYVYKYKDGIINRFLKIAQNHIKLIQAIEKAKEMGLIEEQKRLEKEENDEMLNIIKEFIKYNDRDKTIDKLRQKYKQYINKYYDLLHRCYNSRCERLRNYTSFKEVELFNKKREVLRQFINHNCIE